MEAVHVSQSDRKTFDLILRTMREGWNSGNGVAHASVFAEDADYMVWNGMLGKGREEIAQGHQRIFDTFYRGTTLDVEVEQVRYLAEGVAVVNCRGGVRGPEGKLIGTPTGEGTRPLLILTKRNGRWQIDVFQNTAVVSQAEN